MWKWKITNLVKEIFRKLFSKEQKNKFKHSRRTDKLKKDGVIPTSDNFLHHLFNDHSKPTSVNEVKNVPLLENNGITEDYEEKVEVISREYPQSVETITDSLTFMTKEISISEEKKQDSKVPPEEFQIDDLDNKKRSEILASGTLESNPSPDVLDELSIFLEENLEQIDKSINLVNSLDLHRMDGLGQISDNLLIDLDQNEQDEEEQDVSPPRDTLQNKDKISKDFVSVFNKFIDYKQSPAELDLTEMTDQYFVSETSSDSEPENSEVIIELNEEILEYPKTSSDIGYEFSEESIINEDPAVLESISDFNSSSDPIKDFSVELDKTDLEEIGTIRNGIYEPDSFNEQLENQIENEDNELLDQWSVDVEKIFKEIAKESKQKKKTTKKKRRKFFYDFHDLPKKNNEEINKFINDLEDPMGKKIRQYTIDELEVFFLNCLKKNTLIGELPISKNSFFCINEMIYKNSRKIKSTLPGLFVVSMVFCARYSDDEMRNFWEPYSKMVWKQNNTQYFQIQCRGHFFDCREFLNDKFDMHFPATTYGDVVKPVYFHAVIPYYLQSYFAEWLLQNFDTLMAFSIEDLPKILKSDQCTRYIPPRLKSFIESNETNLVAANLIRQMAKAVKLYKDTEQYDTVYSIMDSPIQRSLWKDIYTKLINDKSIINKVRHYSPKINWVWDSEKENVFLTISNVRSSKEEKPNLLVWAEKDSCNLKNERISEDVYPYMLSNDDWEVETTILQQCGDIEGKIYLLSDEFDLEQSIKNQSEHIVLCADIPNLNEEFVYFLINGNSSISLKRDTIETNGVWLIAGKEDFELENKNNERIGFREIFISPILVNFGYSTFRKYSIDLPVKVITNTQTLEFAKTSNRPILEVSIQGENQIKQANIVPPVFQTNHIELAIKSNNNDVLKSNFNSIWLSIFQGGEFEQSVLLSELFNDGDIIQGENNFIIELKRFLNKSGSFSLNFLLDLRRLLDDPIRFSYLPGVVLIGPDPGIEYSPNNPAEIIVHKLPHHQIKKFPTDNVKIVPSGEKVLLRWKIMKEPFCRFNIQWEGNNIPFYWNIKRITAWVEGTNDNNEIFESDFSKTKLFVRGYPYEEFQWILSDNQIRDYQLNPKGIYEEIIDRTVLRDMLLKCNRVKTELFINIKSKKWKLLTFIQKTSIKISKVNYDDKKLKINIDQQRTLVGDYKLKVTNIERTNGYDLISEENLNNEYVFDRFLTPGTYQIELYSFDELNFTSDKFVVEEEGNFTELTSQVKILNRNQSYTPDALFENLSLSQKEIINLQSKSKIDNLLPYLQQLTIIHTKSEWITDKKFDEGLKNLLPSWAVVNFPLKFISNEHRKVLHIFPQRLAYGIRFGKGYAILKLADEQVKVYAAWNSVDGQDTVNLWLLIPKERNNYSFYDLNELDLWPSYQCIDCGEIVGSREGNYLKLPPNTIIKHLHGFQRNINDQFIDIMYKKHMQGVLSQYNKTKLVHCENIEKVIGNNSLYYLLENKKLPISGNLSKPILFENSSNYECALSELVLNYHKSSAKLFLQQLVGKSNEFNKMYQFIQEYQNSVSSYNASLRLMSKLKGNQKIEYLPRFILILSMILRTRANNPENYRNFLNKTKISDREIINLVDLADKSCPKLFEWSIAWAELFFIHSIS